MGIPDDVRAAAAAETAGLGDARREAFELRLDRWWGDLLDGLAAVYPDPGAVARRLVARAARAYAARPADLHRLDQRRLLEPDWLQQPRMFGYACYTERFGGDLPGLAKRLDHLEALGVTYLHLMPLLQPREGDNDGGYAVQDYRAVRPDLGSMDDLRDLATTLRGRGISLVLDLVLNHVAREHDWAVRARAGDPTYRDFFHVYADRDLPDAFEETLPEVFPDFAPGNFTWDDDLEAWVWTTFNEWQWDLNWGNPDVLVEFADIICTLANLGVEVLRLDAIAFLWKRLGTACQNQPEVHAITQVLRTVARIAATALAFKAEAIVGPRELVQYLGQGRHAGRVSDLAYHNSLMVQAWSMLASGDTVLAQHALASLPTAPVTGTWITYVRCHDDIGWAIDDRDAAAVGLNGHDHRRFLADWYAGDFPGSWAHGLVFQHNPATGDKRISGTAASLAGLEDDVEAALARIFLAHAVGRGARDLERRRARPAQRPGMGHRARARGRQPVGAPTAPRLGRRRPARRPAHGARQGVRGHRPPGQGAGRAPAAARVRTEPGAPRHRPRGARRGTPTPERADGRPLQRDRDTAPVPDRPAARRRPRGAVRRAGRVRRHRRGGRPGLAAAVRRVVGGRRR